MLNKANTWFKSLFNEPPTTEAAPEIMGLHLGGSFEIDKLKLSIIEPQLTIERAAACHLIQAVGKVMLDENSAIFRFYTDDDAFLQVVTDGGFDEQHVSDVKLWYFYDTKSVGSHQQWDTLLQTGVSQPTYQLDEQEFSRVWNGFDNNSPPVAMTETTWQNEQSQSTTDQFVMLYERQLENDEVEALMLSAEEKVTNGIKDHCLVFSTGFTISPTEIRING